MKLETQVTSLELSKKLIELEVKQESLFYYEGSKEELENGKGYALNYRDIHLTWAERVSAFTVSELGEMLPADMGKDVDGDINQLQTE